MFKEAPIGKKKTTWRQVNLHFQKSICKSHWRHLHLCGRQPDTSLAYGISSVLLSCWYISVFYFPPFSQTCFLQIKWQCQNLIYIHIIEFQHRWYVNSLALCNVIQVACHVHLFIGNWQIQFLKYTQQIKNIRIEHVQTSLQWRQLGHIERQHNTCKQQVIVTKKGRGCVVAASGSFTVFKLEWGLTTHQYGPGHMYSSCLGKKIYGYIHLTMVVSKDIINSILLSVQCLRSIIILL